MCEPFKQVASFWKVRNTNHETGGGRGMRWSQGNTMTVLSKIKCDIWCSHEKDKELKMKEKRSMKKSREFQATEI